MGLSARLALALLSALIAVSACGPRATGLPPGPPPEYEKAPVAPWPPASAAAPAADAGAPGRSGT